MKPLQSQTAPKRAPLEDGMGRANTLHNGESSRSPIVHHESHRFEGQLPLDENAVADIENRRTSKNTDTVYPPRVHAADRRAALLALEGKQHAANRDSTYSTTSTYDSEFGGRRERKTHIGPWNLGKTLGKGATARVRLARHCVTHEKAAIKIVQKDTAALTASGSLAALTNADDKLHRAFDDRRMPYGIEREVAIMKLIKHPNILKLLDIWENRTEIYLVLEYAEKGELFEHICANGCLSEKETMKYFRQMLSAIGYCHQFNICHRDLKPENILLESSMNIKIADFGMAALQQNDDHRLITSCGSPHYAAPEVIIGAPYKGDKIDVWSLGVILYACLAGHLPFDHKDIPKLLQIIKRGKFDIPSHVAPDAADLIRRILVVNPNNRLNVRQIWKHPMLKKYEYLDNFDGGTLYKQPSIRGSEYNVLKRSDIDTDLLRSLRSLWHTYSEDTLVELLLNDKQTEQKFFYMLFAQHRAEQLENYVPDTVKYSASDYHHVRPLAQVPRLSTRQFTAVNSHGIRRQVSKFTVITNPGAPSRQGSRSTYVQSDGGETIRSYDPYRASRPQNLAAGVASRANVTVHRTMADRLQEDKMISRGFGSVASSRRSGANSSLMPPRRNGTATRSSLASSTHSRGRVGSAKVKTGLKYKRGISFAHLNAPQTKLSAAATAAGMKSPAKITSPKKLRSPERNCSPTRQHPVRSKKATGASPRKSQSPKKAIPRDNQLFNDDVRQLSHSLAQDCDNAFNFINTSMLSTIPSSLNDRTHGRHSTPLSSFEHRDSDFLGYKVDIAITPTLNIENSRAGQRYDSRPLPPPPVRSESVNKQLTAARQALDDRKFFGNAGHSPRHLNRIANHIDRLMIPEDDRDKRIVSAPTPSKYDKAMPSSFRHSDQNAGDHYAARQGSAQTAPEPRFMQRLSARDAGLDGRRVTARVVPPSSPGVVAAGDNDDDEWVDDKRVTRRKRKASPQTEYFTADVPTHVALEGHGRNSGYSLDQGGSVKSDANQKKKLNWFKRSGKDGQSPREPLQERTNVQEKALPEVKKKGFGLGVFFKNMKRKGDEELENAYGLSADTGVDDTLPDYDDEWEHYQRPGKGKEAASRQIEPRQNFIARLFRVKPVVDYVCFNLSRRRARQELSAMLKQWRQFGMTDIVTDKQRQMVFAKVGKDNTLHIKEVSFAVEVMAVIEHGKRGFLSIGRFTQESGAASSFHMVLKTARETMAPKGYLVRDERKCRMMIKTLQSA